MKMFWIVSIVVILIVSTFSIAAVSNSSTAPNPSVVCSNPLPNQQCVIDPSTIQIEALPAVIYTGAVQYDFDMLTPRWLVTINFNVPYFPAMPFGLNFNKYSLVLDRVVVDQRTLTANPVNEGEFFDGLYISAHLVCDPNGSTNPKLSFSMPRQEITLADGTVYNRIPRSTMLSITNLAMAMITPCPSN